MEGRYPQGKAIKERERQGRGNAVSSLRGGGLAEGVRAVEGTDVGDVCHQPRGREPAMKLAGRSLQPSLGEVG